MSFSPTPFCDLDAPFDHRSGHILIAGSSGTGKTQAMGLIAQQKLRNPLTGLHIVDPDGELSPLCFEFLANPQNGLGWRKVHYLRPASTSEAFALPFLHVKDGNRLLCHVKALRALTVFAQAINFGAADYGPRLQKFFYLGCLGLALSGRPLVDLPDLFTAGARSLRALIGDAFPFSFLSDEWSSVDLLTERAFLEYRDPLISRLLPVFGNEQLRRVFGPQEPLDLKRILANREIVLLDLSGLEHKDAVLVGKAYLSLLYHEALQREPNREPHATLLVDEVFDFLTPDVARGFDRLRKRNIQLCVAIQRFAQLKSALDEDAVAVLSAVVTNTSSKILFGGLEPDDADFMVRVLFTGFVDLEEWKEGSARPTAVGSIKEIVRSSSRAVHEANHESFACTVSHSHGEAIGTMSATMSGSGDFSASAESAGLVMTPPATLFGPNAPTATFMPVSLSQSSGDSTSRGSSQQRASSSGSSRVSMDMEGEAVTHGIGRSRGTSESHGEAETFVTDYHLMPTQMYSLPEQLHRLAAEVMNLPPRECFVKIGPARPVRTRTVDLKPAFRSAYFRRIMLPLFHKKALLSSPYLHPVAEVDALLAARRLSPPLPPEPDFTAPEPLPLADPVHDAPGYARAFWARKKNDAPKKPPGRRPKGELTPEHDRFRVVDGDRDDDGDKEP